MSCFLVNFRERDETDVSNKYLKELYPKGLQPDCGLNSSDKKVVNTNKAMLFMFSKRFREYIHEFNPKGKTYFPCGEFSSFVLQHVIELMYAGQTMVGAEVLPHVQEAVSYLQMPPIHCSEQNPSKDSAQ